MMVTAPAVFAISLTNGSLREVKKTRAMDLSWTEDVMQHVLVLNPQLLGVGDELPVVLDGESTSACVDQMFLDEAGRLTFVEVKNECGDVAGFAQLLSYAEHWHGLPMGEIELGLRHAARRRVPSDALTESLTALRTWAKAKASTTPTTKRPEPWPAWSRIASTAEVRKHYWGADARAFPGAPSRLVFIAPEFSKACIELATSLAKRWVSIALVKVELRRDDSSNVLLSWEPVVTPPDDHAGTWDLARFLWLELPELRRDFYPNAFADHLQVYSFSFSSRAAPAVKLWIQHDGDTVDLGTYVPDNWYADTEPKKRKALYAALLERLPRVKHEDPRWPVWTVKAADRPAIAKQARAMLSALVDVLVPAAPSD